MQGWAAGDLAMTAFHSGGVIKGGTMRKFHGGGGLNPDEKIIIGKAGERVFSQEQSQMVQEMYDSIKNGPAAGGDTHIHNYHINTIDGPSTASFFRNNRRIVADTIQMAKASNHPVRRK